MHSESHSHDNPRTTIHRCKCQREIRKTQHTTTDATPACVLPPASCTIAP